MKFYVDGLVSWKC